MNIGPRSAVTLPRESEKRGDLPSPNAAQGVDQSHIYNRVITMKLQPTPEQWKTIITLARTAANAKNTMMLALWAQAMKLIPDPEHNDARNASILVRQMMRKDLASAVYDAASQAEVRGQWARHGKCNGSAAGSFELGSDGRSAVSRADSIAAAGSLELGSDGREGSSRQSDFAAAGS